jgi:hypothetical protein
MPIIAFVTRAPLWRSIGPEGHSGHKFDNDPHHNLTNRGIATAISKLESSGVPIRNRIHLHKPSAWLAAVSEYQHAF